MRACIVVTVKQVAAVAGVWSDPVSPAFVSRALMREGTRRKMLDGAKQQGDSSRGLAQALRTGHRHILRFLGKMSGTRDVFQQAGLLEMPALHQVLSG
jgi:DNA-binding LacI/PurR family transcriptional regulator